jgi:beta-lactamase class A
MPERSRQLFELQPARLFAEAELAIVAMKRLNFSTTNPKATTAIPVRTQARKVRSLAAWSLYPRIMAA